MRLNTDSKSFKLIMESIGILERLGFEFLDALGKCEIFHNLSALLPSRFATTNPNGAWDYSPFLCGAGLAEGLELLYRSVMILWERMKEPMLVVHLHNMLVQRGCLKQAIPLYSRLGMIFSDSFFSDGQPPTGDYVEAFHSQVNKTVTRQDLLQQKTNRRAAGKVTNTREFLNLTILRVFKQKSDLSMYRSADWDPDRVPDSDVNPSSALAMIRLSQTRRFRDPVTSNWRLEETDFVKRTRAAGIDESFKLDIDPADIEILRDVRLGKMFKMTSCISDCAFTQLSWLHNIKTPQNQESNVKTTNFKLNAEMMLGILYSDIHDDIYSGVRPFSSLNYIYITVRMLWYFEELEQKSRNSNSTPFKCLFSGVDKSGNEYDMSDKRLRITLRALGGKDEELLESMAKVFERCGGRFEDCIYWGFEDDEANIGHKPASGENANGSDCCVM